MNHGTTSQAQSVLTVATYNIHGCINVFGRENPSAVARVVDAVHADVVALQEVDFSVSQNGTTPCNQAQWIGELLNMRHRFYALRPSRRGAFGLGLLSKVPLSFMKTGVLSKASDGPVREPRGAMWYRLQTRHGEVSLINTHLSLRRQDRLRQIDDLMSQAWIGGLPAEEPVILCGDLNADVRSPVYRVLTSRYSDVQLQTGQKGYPRRTFLTAPFGDWTTSSFHFIFE